MRRRSRARDDSSAGTPALLPEREIRLLRAPILRWYRRNRRDLPWRRTRDPYAVWVSEIMLQQTRVAAALPYYERFLERFPDVASLARASEEAVLAAWSGLGYYRRARALREGAIVVMERHGGRLPDEAETLLGIPGIGRYTAGAIASVAFGREEPVVDGNVERVLCRVLAFAADGGARDRETLWSVAGVLVRGPHPGHLNQALMELGATVCLPRDPACGRCPWKGRCRALVSGDPAAFPSPRPRPAAIKVRVAVALVERGGRVLLERSGGGSPFRGRWDVPAREVAGRTSARKALLGAFGDEGIALTVGPLLARASHSILDRRLGLEIHGCAVRGTLPSSVRLRWIERDAIDEAAVSGATRKVLRKTRRET